MGMFRIPPGLLAGIAYGVMSGLIPDAKRKMAEQRAKLAKEAGEPKGRNRYAHRYPDHGKRFRTPEHRAYREKVKATHTGGDHTKDPRPGKYLNRSAREVRAYARETQAAI